MQIKRIYCQRSNKYIIEKHKPIIPTIIYFRSSGDSLFGISLKFAFWKWWFMIFATINKKP